MLNEKIKSILLDKNLSPSRFADEIGVQRSSISHILSGRNKPSLEIIQKILKRFPELGMEWIMEDVSMHQQNSPGKSMQTPATSTERPERKITQASISNLSALAPKTEGNIPVMLSNTGEKRIEKILIFYSDKTFDEYIPG
jgi:transcriptional regulator with XRE-family HTH domain